MINPDLRLSAYLFQFDSSQQPINSLIENFGLRQQTDHHQSFRSEIKEVSRMREHVVAFEQFCNRLLFGADTRRLNQSIPTAFRRKKTAWAFGLDNIFEPRSVPPNAFHNLPL